MQLEGERGPTYVTVPDELQELAPAGWPFARSAVALIRSHAAQEEGDVETAIAVLDDLGGPHPQVRRVAVAARLMALGHPERVATTLDEVLAEDGLEPVAAQAVWFRGDIAPEVAWPFAAGLPAAYGHRRLAAVEVPLLSIVSAVAVSAGALHGRAGPRRQRCRPAPTSSAGASHCSPRSPTQSSPSWRKATMPSSTASVSAVRSVPLAGWPAWAYLGALTPIRALVAGTEWLDDLEVGPAMRTAIDAGRAVAELRSGVGPGAAIGLPWSSSVLLRVHVPPPLLCELAVAAASVPAAAELVEHLPGAARWVRGLAEHRDRAVRARATDLASRMPLRPDHDLVITTFRTLRVARTDGVEVTNLDRRGRLRQLLARLVLVRSTIRSDLAEAMWPDLSPDQAANNLRVTLSKLLDVLEPDRGDTGSWWIRTSGDRIELNSRGTAPRRRRVRPPPARGSGGRGAGGTVGRSRPVRGRPAPLHRALPGRVDDPSVSYERLRLQGLAYGAACRQAELLAARGEPEAALGAAANGVRIDPSGERAYRVMIGCHLALGAKEAARSTAALIDGQLTAAGTPPEPETLRVLSFVQR